MNRPYVICHILMSIDGKISGDFMSADDSDALKRYAEMRSEYGCQANIYGFNTMREGFSEGILESLAEPYSGKSREDFIADNTSSNYIVSIDPFGTLAFSGAYCKKPGRPDAHIIEVLTESVANEYLEYLRNKKISYIICGNKTVDVQIMLKKLKHNFGIEKAMLSGGGITDRVFLEADLIDELSLVVAPMISSDKPAISLFETVDFLPAGNPKKFKLKSANVLESGVIVTKYIR